MKIHEFQAKNILKDYKIQIPEEKLCLTIDSAVKATQSYGGRSVIKAQIHSGGRWKMGGVKVANSPKEAQLFSNQILGANLNGYRVDKILVSEFINIKREYYVGITVNRKLRSLVLMVSREGGVDIENVNTHNPENIFKHVVDNRIGVKPYVARTLSVKLFKDIEDLSLRKRLIKECSSIIMRLYSVVKLEDAVMVEVNPLALTDIDQLVAIDCKMTLEDNALYKHPTHQLLRDISKEEEIELEAKNFGLSYVKLDGNIGCIVNGAGLAMATMDIIKLYGGSAANFLDVGGSSNPHKVVKAFEYILDNPKVDIIMINIFGGITRCDDIANGLILALDKLNCKLPIVARLAGTNSDIGLEILRSAGIETVETMSEAAERVIKLSKSKTNIL